MLGENEQGDRSNSDILPLLTQLNAQLDQWTSSWLWIGEISQYRGQEGPDGS